VKLHAKSTFHANLIGLNLAWSIMKKLLPKIIPCPQDSLLRSPPVKKPQFTSANIHPNMSFSVPSSTTARCCRSLLRKSSKKASTSQCIRLSSSAAHINLRRKESRTNSSRRWASTDASAAAAPISPKISGIVDQISQLTLLETADLVANLKVCMSPLDPFRLEARACGILRHGHCVAVPL
jgi:hypothetical protein